MSEADKIVAGLTPEDGWYKRSTEDTVRSAVATMLHHGLPPAIVESVLEDVIGAIGEEYGD